MAQRIQTYSVTCPANTAQAAAIETELSMRPGIVRAVRIIIPPGHAGLTGIALAQAHQVMIPASGSVFIQGDDRDPRFELENFLDADTWSALTYNTDAEFSHTWFLEFEVDEIQAPVQVGQGPIAVSDIYAAGAAAA